MTKLKLGAVIEERPVKVSLEIPAKLFGDLTKYAELLSRENDRNIADPTKLIVPMLERFISTDRAFVKARRDTTPR